MQRGAGWLLFLIGSSACGSDPTQASDPRRPQGEAGERTPAADGGTRELDAAPSISEPADGSRAPAAPVDAALTPDAAPVGTPDGGAVQPASALPECPSSAPAEFTANASIGGGGGAFTDSPHFRIYGGSATQVALAIDMLEAAYSCFVETLCWRSSGLSYNASDDDGPFTKTNLYVVGNLGSAAGVMSADAPTGMSFLRVVGSYLGDPTVSVHEYGHALTYHAKGWVEQTRTGAWWETVANFVADTFSTSPLCAAARDARGLPEGDTLIDLAKVIGASYQVLVDGSQGSGNYYQAWPFLTYLTTNPDALPGLGATAVRDLFRAYMRNNETPLHTLARVAAPSTVPEIVGRYWARMAYVDIGHAKAQARFFSQRAKLDFANLDATGSGSYRVKSARRPRYFGANIIPLEGTGEIRAHVSSSSPFRATLAVRKGANVRYLALEDGQASVTLEADEEASLVVVNTPDQLYQYDPFSLSSEVSRGLDYTLDLSGATP